MCKEKFGHSITKEVEEKDGTKFMLTHVALPSISILERALEKIKSMYKEQFGHSVDDPWIGIWRWDGRHPHLTASTSWHQRVL